LKLLRLNGTNKCFAEWEGAEKRRDTEEIDKMISCFGEILMKHTKTFKETLRNEILFCRKEETGMTGVLWQKIMTSTYFVDLVAADASLSYIDCHVFLELSSFT